MNNPTEKQVIWCLLDKTKNQILGLWWLDSNVTLELKRLERIDQLDQVDGDPDGAGKLEDGIGDEWIEASRFTEDELEQLEEKP